MKTLSDLKRRVQSYAWQLTYNSWREDLPEFQKDYRLVGRVQTHKFTLLTDKNGDGKLIESWIDFPKASEVTIAPLGNDCYQVTITRKIANEATHVIVYNLKPVSEENK